MTRCNVQPSLSGREDIFMEEATVIQNATEKDVTRIDDMIAALCEFQGGDLCPQSLRDLP